ncbi:MAG TPA: NAD(P)/FAD-dependent oxidoreductase [Chloroflexota bacterium]|nr:NAD(P)/FAD-dependent oxidoreductase [Chloroflexota bacterium]
MAERYEAVVVGGGPAGSSTARELARQGHEVLLLDAARFPRRKACAEYISPGGAAILERLGVFEILGNRNAGRWLDGMTIRAPSGATHLVDYRDTRGDPRRGLSIARTCLDAALVRLAKASGVTVREGCRVSSVLADGDRVRGVRLVSGQEIKARLVIGADGLHSVVARAAGPPLRVVWPRRLGLVAHLDGIEWPERSGQLLVGQHGYVGVAPLDEHGLLTVGLVRPLKGARGPAGNLFAAELSQYGDLAARLARGQRAETVMGIGPLARRVRACAGAGWLLVGDAAGFFDPFTGEGIFRALRGAELAAAYSHGVLSTDCERPVEYARQRQRAFAAKERLTAIIQVFVQCPRLLDLAIRRLEQRPAVARQLGDMLGDLAPARLGVVAHLLSP